MALLTTPQKRQIYSAICRAYSDERITMPWTEPEIMAELDALDTFQDGTADTAINNQFSAGYKATSSIADRALLYIALNIRRRLIADPTNISLLRTILNNVEV